ncbi:DUF1329 domain-containing protein [Paraburkholderia dipogonis]|uniref:DUF1329 domain-containing protein n=1 Tax=Paraburkholderia dipogonis TaxID=1211383 RepID=A0A4Y8NB13_9BURK|nr:DUF1329 domain-containing protein [Paraburkholderia dipogonis]TFE46987.1 DUF1329 domain-containing protein [Paraburkholderia dipogonis]
MQQSFKGRITYCLAALLATSIMTATASAVAAELPSGTVVSKANLDQVKNDTFMGHTIASLLTDREVTEINNFNRKFQLVKSAEPVVDSKWSEATEKDSGDVKYDPKTREITGYKAGLPFPTINQSDPDAGEKIMWNYYYGSPSYPHDFFSNVSFLTFNSSGFESSQGWVFDRTRNRGRLGGSTSADGGDWLSKTIFVGVSPQDIKGTGTFTTRYDVAGKLEDQFVYIKSARRVRRLSGNAWMDPVGGFDFLDDDLFVYNSRPSQYLSNKVIGKRWILAGVDTKLHRDSSKSGSAEEWPVIDSKDAPYWNAIVPMTPREVWVVECTPPSEHPYGKKIVYVDTKLYGIYRGEITDKKGEPWRAIDFYYGPLTGNRTGIKYISALLGTYVDFKAHHATFFATPDAVVDRERSVGDYSPNALESYQ